MSDLDVNRLRGMKQILYGETDFDVCTSARVYNEIHMNGSVIGSSQKAKQKYRGMFETQKSGDKTSSGEIGLDITTNTSPKVGHDQVSGGVSVLCWHNASVPNVLWKPHTIW